MTGPRWRGGDFKVSICGVGSSITERQIWKRTFFQGEFYHNIFKSNNICSCLMCLWNDLFILCLFSTWFFTSIFFSPVKGGLQSTVWGPFWHSAADPGVGIFLPARGVTPGTKFFAGRQQSEEKLSVHLTLRPLNSQMMADELLLAGHSSFPGIFHVWHFFPWLRVGAVCVRPWRSEEDFAAPAGAAKVD